MKELSIIIPVYNAESTIVECLDSIYNQQIEEDVFEVICVDDCSKDNSVNIMSEYAQRHTNLTILRHNINKRQGGGRNTGVKYAKGRYIWFVDSDDFLEQRCVSRILQVLQTYPLLDILALNYVSHERGEYNVKMLVTGLESNKIMSGLDFVKTQENPWGTWAPWLFIFQKSFLLNDYFHIVEDTTAEDLDFIIKCTIRANYIMYVPIIGIHYILSDNQTTKISADTRKVGDRLAQSIRVKLVGDDVLDIDRECAILIYKKAISFYRDAIIRYIWMLSHKDRVRLLKANQPDFPLKVGFLMSIALHFPVLFSLTLSLCYPILPLIKSVYIWNKKRKGNK